MASTQTSQEIFSIIADIGGTNARLQLIRFNSESSEPTVVQSTFYLTKDYPRVNECLRDFLKEFEGTDKYPKNATFAVAAAPFNNKLKMVNCHWPEMDGDALGKEFSLYPFNLINDFEAIGYSLLKVTEKDLLTIHDAPKIEGKAMAVVGSGTGLGECVLNANKDKHGNTKYYVCPTEGGHKDFAPTNKIDFDYLQYCFDTVPEVKEMNYVSVERSFCGPAVPTMYKFFAQREGVEAQEISSKDIFQKGLKKEDSVCAQVLEFYARLYGKEVGNFACDSLPYGGIYLVGGMINSVSDYFTKDPENPFMRSYLSKDKVTNNVLSKFPIYIVTAEELGLLGAFVKAQIDAFGSRQSASSN